MFWFELAPTSAPQLARQDPAELRAAAPAAGCRDGTPRAHPAVRGRQPGQPDAGGAALARRPDIRLLSARDGQRGIELARAYQPDVILMDINLPGISGIDGAAHPADDPATAHIPVIALSANAMPRDIEKGLEAGFFHYLTKPIKVAEFMDTLDLALNAPATAAGPATATRKTP